MKRKRIDDFIDESKQRFVDAQHIQSAIIGSDPGDINGLFRLKHGVTDLLDEVSARLKKTRAFCRREKMTILINDCNKLIQTLDEAIG